MKFSEKLQSLFPYLISIALWCSPFLVVSLVKNAGYYDNQRLLEVFCVGVALVVILWKIIDGNFISSIYQKEISIFLIIFFLLGFFSSTLSYSPRHAIFEWANILLLFGAASLIASEVRFKGDRLLDRLLMLCGLSCASYILVAILMYVSALKSGTQPDITRLIFGYDNYRFFNHVQTISLPLLGLLAARMPERDRRLIWWGVTSLWWMLFFVGAGRGTLLGLLAGIALALVALRRQAVAWCVSLLLSGLAGLVLYLLLYVLLPVQRGLEPFGLLFSRVARSVSEDPSSGRLQLWARAWEMVQAHPWVGAGPAHFAHVARDLPYGAHPHNWVLQVASEWGLPALFFLCAALALSISKLLRLRWVVAAKQRDTLTAWLVTGGAILVDGLFSGLIVMPVSQLWIALYLGCAWGWTAPLSSSVTEMCRGLYGPGRGIARRGFAVLAALLLVVVLIWGIGPELREQSLLKVHFPEKYLFRPRLLGHTSF